MRAVLETKIFRQSGFTIFELLCVLLLLGVIAVLSTRMVTNFVTGYAVARNSDAAVQIAQNAMQRMTIDFTWLDSAHSSGKSNYIAYNTFLESDAVRIFQEENTIVYSVSETPYVLADGVAAGSLRFSYYNAYAAAPDMFFSNATRLIGISFTMVGDDPGQGFSQTYSTRVALEKTQDQ